MPARVGASAVRVLQKVGLKTRIQAGVVAPVIRTGERTHMRTVQRVRCPERHHVLRVVQAGIVALRTRARLQHFIAALLHGARKLQPVLVKRRLGPARKSEELSTARPESVGLGCVCSASLYSRASLIDISLARSKARKGGAESAAHQPVSTRRRRSDACYSTVCQRT